MGRLLLAAIAAIGIGALASSAGALTIDIESGDQADLADGLLDDGDTAVSGPLTITFSNIVTSDGIPGALVDSDGIFFGRDPFAFAVVSMDMTFSAPIVLTAYDIDFIFPDPATDTATFQILGPGGTATGEMDFLPDISTGPRLPFDMGTIAFFAPGEIYTFIHTVKGEAVSQIDEFDFRVVPLPPSLALLGSSLAVFGLAGWRRRSGRTQQAPARHVGSA